VSLQASWISYGPEGKYTGYLAKPSAIAGPLPAVIVLQEIWGVDPHIQDVTNRFAMAGYVAFAPDLYALNGERPAPLKDDRIESMKAFLDSLPIGSWGNQEAREQALSGKPEQERKQLKETQEAIFNMDFPGYLKRVTAAAAYLRDEEPASKGQKVGSVGFCLGGALSAQLACLDPQLSAAVIFYGNAPQPEQLAGIACPVLGLYGGKDARITDNVPAFADAMKAAGKTFVSHVYPEAPHAFFNDTRPSYRADAARDAFSRTLAFLNEHLS
jgi:carboxymethylenebutenolidase